MADETTTDALTPEDEEFPPTNFQPLRATLEAEGGVGGEFQAFYGFHAVEGQTLTVRLTFSGNKANFSVYSDSEEDAGEALDLGPQEETDGGSSQTGTVRKTGLYLIGITGDVGDAADYRLRVTLE